MEKTDFTKQKTDFTKTVCSEYLETLISNAERYKSDGEPLPIKLFEFARPSFTAQLNYIGNFGAPMLSLVDLKDPYTGEPHGYPKIYQGDITAFWMEILRELSYIESIHLDTENTE